MSGNKSTKGRNKTFSSTNSKRRTQRYSSEDEMPGLIPAMYSLAEALPEEFQQPAKTVIGIFGFVVIAVFAIFILGAIIATLTGHPEQTYTIFPAYIYGIGIVAVTAIFLTSKKTIK